MKMARYMLVVLVVGMLFGGVLVAQDTLPPTVCTQEDYLALQTGISNLIGGLSDNALYDPTHIMMQVRTAIETYQLLCNQLFTHETHPSGIVGPIAFDGTLYQVAFITYLSPDDMYDLGGVAGLVTVEGDCGLHSASTDRADKPDLALWELGEGCVGMIEITSDLWELSFVKIR